MTIRKNDGGIAPVFGGSIDLPADLLRCKIVEVKQAWLLKSRSHHTRDAYDRDLAQFMQFYGVDPTHLEQLLSVRPMHVAKWIDVLMQDGCTNSTIARKVSAVRSLFSYLKTYGYTGANPAHSHFVSAPPVPKDGITPELDPHRCRELLDAPDDSPAGYRDAAMFASLAFGAIRVGELVRLKVKDYRETGVHRVYDVYGKGGKHRRIPLNPETGEKLEAYLNIVGLREHPNTPLFRPTRTARGRGRDGWDDKHLTTRAVQNLLEKYSKQLGFPRGISVHSLRVTALSQARRQGFDIIDLQAFAGHATAEVTQRYIRSEKRMAESPAYAIRYD
ncbi:tyrosine-type recombinase/integrase [uncultured Gimesia sp.]|uniref:tyrosine-type recombinase/integrase n=1 Tax=uncultured Gimesia sp. TaxID=1678688 RepID=UPI0026053EA4|nr:tyrosine-type recombinase/integrase [uncultured Gimesia sp.]